MEGELGQPAWDQNCTDKCNQTVDLSTASLSALAQFLSEQAPQHGRFVHALRLSNSSPSRHDVPTDLELITSLAIRSRNKYPSLWRSEILDAIIPLLPNLRRLSFDVSLAHYCMDDNDPLPRALAASSVSEQVRTQEESRREVEGEALRIGPKLVQLLSNLQGLTLRLTLSRSAESCSQLLEAVASLERLEYLAIIGNFEFECGDRKWIENLRCPLRELVISRGCTPLLRRILTFLQSCEGTMERVRIGVRLMEVGRFARTPFKSDLQDWCLEKKIALELVEETEWDYLGGDEWGEEDLEEPVWEWSEDELGNVARERVYERYGWSD